MTIHYSFESLGFIVVPDMTWEMVGDIALDSLFDSLKVLGFAFVIYLLLSFFEDKIARLLQKNRRWGPIFGALFGAIPQCGIPVVGADLYLKRHISMGTVVAIFLACSDEALPIFFSSFNRPNWWMVFPMLGIKMVFGIAIGLLVDLIYKKDVEEEHEHLEHCEGVGGIHHGCCGHEIEGKTENPWKEHLVHPLVHSLKIFAYSFVVSFGFGLLVQGVGVDSFNAFLSGNYYLSPLMSALIGLIPNCASSVLISELYLMGGIPFGALITGLSINAGLGPLYLFKSKERLKQSFAIMGICLFASIALGYALIWITL